MGARNRVVTSIAFTGEDKKRVDDKVKYYGTTLSRLVLAAVEALDSGEIELIDGEIYKADKPVYQDRVHRNFEKFVEIMTEKGYPQVAIEQATEQILEGTRGMGKYNPKRSRYSDTGC